MHRNTHYITLHRTATWCVVQALAAIEWQILLPEYLFFFFVSSVFTRTHIHFMSLHSSFIHVEALVVKVGLLRQVLLC